MKDWPLLMLLEYGQHKTTCRYRVSRAKVKPSCDCGWAEAVEKARHLYATRNETRPS